MHLLVSDNGTTSSAASHHLAQGFRHAMEAAVHAMVQHNGQADRSLYGGIEGEGKSWSRRGMDLR